jgi:hypothetical protein
MARASHGFSKNQRSSRVVTAAVAVCLAFGWVWLVAGTRLHEMMVGAGVVVVSTLYLKTVHESSRNTFRLEWKDIVQGWRIPWYMVSDTWVVTCIFIRDLLHLRPAGSYFRASHFECSKRDPAIQGRGVLATIFLTATPNSIVLGIDPESDRMLFHQLQRAPVPQMARALGGGS